MFFSVYIQAQDLFVKQTISASTPPQGRVSLVLLADKGLVSSANYSNGKSNKAIVLHRYSACGELLWSKSLEHTESLNLADMQIDSLGNIVLAGHFSSINSLATPFLISVSANGELNFFKRYDVNPNFGHYAYSLGISPSNEYYLYINYNTSTAGPEARVSLLKLDHLGGIKWHRIYNYFSWHYGFMIATKDGGVLLNMNIDLIKIDSGGKLEWVAKYDGRELYKPIETQSGYAFSFFDANASLSPHLLMLNKDGSFKWDIKNFDFISARKGIVRRNGNLLLMGNVKNSSNELGFVELNSFNGELIKYKSIELDGVRVDDLAEDKKENVFFSGVKNNQITIAKLNDTLSTLSCSSINLKLNYSFDTLIQLATNIVGSTLNSTTAKDEAFTETDLISSTLAICSYFENHGVPDLGNDTSICLGESIILGVPNSNFAAYKWSTGESSKTIKVTNAGQYILNVLSACDTLRDTLGVSYYSSILPKFDFSPAQIMTNDTVRFRNLTANSFNAKWNMGNGDELYVDTLNYSYEVSGSYKVTLTVESSNGCLFFASDFISILPSNYHIPNVFSPNNDGVNDEFKPMGEDIESFDLSIYNRWGGEVFSNTNISWNGFTKNGEKAQSGNYFYKIIIYFNNGKAIAKAGVVSLLR